MLMELSLYVTISEVLQQNCRDLCLYFLWTTYCKSEIELSGQQKVMEEIKAEEIATEGPLVERSSNEKNVSGRDN